MNGVTIAQLSLIGIIAACVLVPPLAGGMIEGVFRRFVAKKQGRDIPPLLQPFQEIVAILRQTPMSGSSEQTVCVLLSITFQVAALLMLVLQRDLPPVLFMQGFGVLALIMGGISRAYPYFGLSVNHALKAFLYCQSVLFLAAIGVFFATGSFNLGAVKEYPRLLVLDLPLLFMALLLVELTTRNAACEGALNADLPGDPGWAVASVSNCFRSSTLMLVAGFFVAHSLTGAVMAAGLLYVILLAVSNGSLKKGWPLKFEWSWGYVFFACGLNLVWIYIKYWM